MVRINPGAWHYSIDFSINPSVLAFSIKVRTFARSSPNGISAAIFQTEFHLTTW